MARSLKAIKLKIESTNGTTTNKSAWRHAQSMDTLPEAILPPSFWRHPIRWIRHKLWERRIRKYVLELIEDGQVGVYTSKTVPYALPDERHKWN